MTKKEFKPELIEYIGPSGAGKTTLAKKQVKKIRAEGKRVLTFEYYKKHRLILIWDLLRFPFFIIKKRKQIKDIWNLFKKDIKLKTKIKHTLITAFVIYKTLNLIRKAKKKNIKKIILDQGYVQNISSLLYRKLVEESEIKKELLNWVTDKADLKILKIEVSPEEAAKRRLKRQDYIDKNKSKQELIQETKNLDKIIDNIKNVFLSN